MAGIPDEVIQTIRDRVDFLAIVQKRVELKRVGRSWVGLCPFHNEKSASFNVHPERGFFHCFGCQVSGDVFKFIMETEHQPFPVVARDLAKELGIDIPENHESNDEKKAREKREWLYRVNDYLNQYFMHQLWNSREAQHARAYVQTRGLSDDTARAFQLGYAPKRTDDLLRYLEAKRMPVEYAIELGVLGKREDGSMYLRFFDRLLFPIHDDRDRIAGFGGRVLDKEAKAAKYLNSPESAIFKKSKLLYGFSKAKNSIARKGSAWLCEGYLDVIALHQAGLDQACAPLGTALTEDHVPLLRRVTSKIHTIFDGDSAGMRATRKCTELLLAHGFAVHVVDMPPGDDPDTLVLREGAEATLKRINSAPPAVQFFIEKAAAAMAQTVAGRVEAAKDIGPLLNKIASQLERDLYLREAAKQLSIDERSLRRFFGWKNDANTAFSEARKSKFPFEQGQTPTPAFTKGATNASAQPKIPPPNETEFSLVGALIRVPTSWDAIPVLLRYITHEGLKSLLAELMQDPEIDAESMISRLGPGRPSLAFSAWLEDDQSALWDEYQLEALKRGTIAHLKDYFMRREVEALNAELRDCQDSARCAALVQQVTALTRKRMERSG